MKTDIFFQWHEPRRIGPVLEIVNSYLEKQSLVLMAGQYPGLMSTRYQFNIDSNDTREGIESYYVKNPWRLNSNLLRAGFRWLGAKYFNSNGVLWFSLSISTGEGDGCPYNGVKDRKLAMMRIILKEEITDDQLSEEESIKMVLVYNQCENLFNLLDCDSVDCYSEGFGLLYWSDPDPDHENKVFRFAKIGRQVHVRMFENGLPLTCRKKEVWREVIDP